jgi:hypothetical protein
MVTPLMHCPDSLDYYANAVRLMESGTAAQFDGWRSPGYSVLIAPALAFSREPLAWIGLVQWVCVAGTIVLLADAARVLVGAVVVGGERARRVAGWAGGATAAVVASDPWTLLWHRHAMPEAASAVAVAVAAWVLARWACAGAGVGAGASASRGRSVVRADVRAVVCAGGLGAFLGVACYVRGNAQVLVVLVPVCLACVEVARGRSYGRAAVVGGACALAGVAVLVPWMVETRERTGRWTFTTGGDFARALFGYETGLVDVNQSHVFDAEQFSRVREATERGALGAYGFIHEMNTGLLAGMGGGGGGGVRELPQLARTDLRARVVVDEAVSRRADVRVSLAARAMATQVGVWAFDVPGFRENEYWSRAMRPMRGQAADPTGGDNYWADPEAMAGVDASTRASIESRTRRDVRSFRAGGAAWAFEVAWRVGEVVRPLAAVVAVVGVCVVAAGVVVGVGTSGGVRERVSGGRSGGAALVCVLGLAGLVVAHAAAIAWVVMTGLDRYAFAVTPLWHMVGVCAVVLVVARVGEARVMRRA